MKSLAFFLIVSSFASAIPTAAQSSVTSATTDTVAEGAINAAMSGPQLAGAERYMKMTPTRPATAEDSSRALTIVATLRGALGKYRDYHVALDEGFRIFLPDVPQQVYHFTNYRRAIRASMSFDPAEPTSLLYRKTENGYELTGAMYTAPARFTEAELDARVPLGIARWHEQVNLCLPKDGAARWRERRDGKLLFGPLGTIATRTDCDSVDGRFVPRLFGWMVHVNPFASDPTLVWGTHEHEMHDMH